MLNESILNLQIALLVIVGTVIYILVCRKRRELLIYLPTYIIFPFGEVFIYLQVFDSMYRLIGNILFMLALLTFISAIFYEYFTMTPKKHHSRLDKVHLNMLTIVLVGIQILLIILLAIVIYMVLSLYRRTRKAKYISISTFFIFALLSGIATVLSNFNFVGVWEFSYLTNILLGAVYFSFPIITYLEERIILFKKRFKLEKMKAKFSEEKYRLITENANDLIAMLNSNYEYEYINENAYHTILGYSKNDLIGEKVWNLVNPEDVKYLVNSREIATTTFDELNVVDKAELRIRHKEGHYVWLEYTSRMFLDNKGNAKVIVISRDISEKKKAEEIIKEENTRLLDLDRLRRELITRISHELKTPLTSIYGASQILIRSDIKDSIERIYPLLKIQHKGSLRLKELVNNLIDASKLEVKKLKLNRSYENISTILMENIDILKILANGRKLTLDVNFPEKIYYELDRNRFSEAFTNILSNAIKNTPPLGKVFIKINEANDHIDIIVKDTGVGITENERKILFNKFGKIERYGMDLDIDIEGAGLGLYISKEIIELHGGEILVESEGRNKGSTFIIRLKKSKFEI